ncbi:hypothetical protein H0H87_000210 [Tephrocybe sp. NHM501043]|nr:hypothetical protein H0H87_000210 [Tephrocybe sp. NHM501043]
MQQPESEPVYWLTGPAGIGKTTIAKTICELVDHRYNGKDTKESLCQSLSLSDVFSLPLVSYFCSRQLDSGDTALLVSTICRQLCDKSSSYAASLAEALEKDSELAYATLDIQLKEMLMQPWEASASERVGLPPVIIIVDALDENQGGTLFLQHLLHAVGATGLKGLKFFVTSREDEQISRLCNTLPEGTILHLQNIPKHTVHHDIELYLAHTLPDLHSHVLYHKLLKNLTKMSDGLFIYAATVVKMVTANNAALTEQVQVLQKIVNLSTHLQLEGLYSEIVKKAVSHHDNTVQASRLQVLHTILCAMHPISVSVLADLSKTTVEVVALVLGNLHAVMYKADDGMIYTYHASFADYILQAPITATIFNPHCNAGMHHEFLAMRCYEIMEKQLCFNICGLESSFVKDVDVPDLAMRIEDRISNTLKYAVFKWMAHTSLTSGLHEVVQNKPQHFVEKLLLFWIEVVNLLNGRREGMQMFDMLITWISKETWSRRLKGHTNSIWSVAFFLDGKQVLSGSSDYTVCIWDALTGDLVKELKGHTSPVWSVAVSPDGKHVVSGSADQTVHIWDALTGDLVKELKGHTAPVRSVAFSPDGKQVVSGSDDPVVYIWDALTGDLVKELKGHTSSVDSVSFSPDGKQVVSGSDDQTVCIWDALIGDLVKELKGHTKSVSSVAFSPDSKHELKGHTRSVPSVAFSPDGTQVVSGSIDKTVCIWDALIGDLVKEFKGHTSSVLSVAFSPDGTKVVTGSYDQTVCIWDAFTGVLVMQVKGHSSYVLSVAFSPDGKQVVSGSNDHTVCIWNALTGDLVNKFDGHTSSVLSVGFPPDGKQVVSGSYDQTVCIWDALTGDLVKELKGHTSSVDSVAFSPDGKQVVSGSNDQTVCIWDVLTGDLVKELKGHTSSVLSVAFSPDGKQVMSGSHDQTVHIWDVLTGDLVKELKGHTSLVLSVAFSPDGKQVVSGSYDQTVCIWDAWTGDLAKELKGHTRSVLSVAFSPDGKQVVSGSYDQTVHIWDALTGDLVKNHPDPTLSGTDRASIIKSVESASEINLWSIDQSTATHPHSL